VLLSAGACYGTLLLSTFVCCMARLRHGALSAPSAIDRYLLPARRSAANRAPLLLSIDAPHAVRTASIIERDEQSDGQTDSDVGKQMYRLRTTQPRRTLAARRYCPLVSHFKCIPDGTDIQTGRPDTSLDRCITLAATA